MAKPRSVILDGKNLDEHHICCALGDPKHAAGVERTKAWLQQRFKEGLVCRKLDERGKVFIEYMPSEKAWRPIVAPGWLTIHCLWVSGRFAKQGHACRSLTVTAAKGSSRATRTQCPFEAHWAAEMAETIEQEGREVALEHIRSCARAQKVASPLGAFGLEQGGALVTHHLNTPGAVKRLLSCMG